MPHKAQLTKHEKCTVDWKSFSKMDVFFSLCVPVLVTVSRSNAGGNITGTQKMFAYYSQEE